jgi:hypothetical protein
MKITKYAVTLSGNVKKNKVVKKDSFRSTKAKLVYTDAAGNTLWKKIDTSTGRVQWSAKNKSGRLVDEEGVKLILQRSGQKTKITGGFVYDI